MLRHLALIALAVAPPAHADTRLVSDDVVTQTYEVSGDSLYDVQEMMARIGPKGFWAYTETYWNWDESCRMRFRANVTMPELVERDRLTKVELEAWDKMVIALLDHEMEHVTIGRDWAGAIVDAGCDPSAVTRINQEHGDNDAELDRVTDHGRLTGVTFDLPGGSGDTQEEEGGRGGRIGS